MTFQPSEPYRPPVDGPSGGAVPPQTPPPVDPLAPQGTNPFAPPPVLPPQAPPPLASPLFNPPRPPRPQAPPSTGRSRRWVLAAALAGALFGVLAGGGGWYLLNRHDGGKAITAATGTAAPTATTAPSPTLTTGFPSPTPTLTPASTPTPTPTATATGARLSLVQDPAGFGLLVPDGWRRRPDGPPVFYDSPDGESLIQVFSMGGGAPYDQAVATDASLASNPARFPGYHRIRLEQTPGGGAELEYAYDLAGHGVRRVVDHILVAPDGQAWAVLVAGPEASWPTPSGDLLHSAVGSFCLAGRCPTG
ncbi:hypothetical protein ABZW30_27340 [Kitasatospora sp. NPDC004669]|uniref:hypothetical protein n=1 Tax=Kitasatospora sp. NPDC004669 TaxID=3154555 RepID=UPI0033A31BCF